MWIKYSVHVLHLERTHISFVHCCLFCCQVFLCFIYVASVNCITLLFNGVHIIQVNVRKTKEMVTDFGKNSFTVPPSQISGELVELVSTYKYLEAQINWQTGFP